MDYYSPKPRKADHSVWRGAAAGLIGGLLGAWTMNKFQSVWSATSKSISERERERSHAGNSGAAAESRIPNSADRRTSAKSDSGSGTSKANDSDDDATMKTASRLARAFTGKELSKAQKKMGGSLIHYGYGAAIGALYGAAAERNPTLSRLAGLPFGAALFVGGDEIAVPALHLSTSPLKYPLSSHLYGLTSHFVYGVTTELSRRLLRHF